MSSARLFLCQSVFHPPDRAPACRSPITTASPITRCVGRIRWPRWTWLPDATTPTKPSTSESLGWPDRYGEITASPPATGSRSWHRTRTDTFDVQFACGRLGAIFVPLNWRLANPELLAILADCTPAMLIYDPEFAERAGHLAQARGIGHLVSLGLTFERIALDGPAAGPAGGGDPGRYFDHSLHLRHNRACPRARSFRMV